MRITKTESTLIDVSGRKDLIDVTGRKDLSLQSLLLCHLFNCTQHNRVFFVFGHTVDPIHVLLEFCAVEVAVVVTVEVCQERRQVVEVHRVSSAVWPLLIQVLPVDFRYIQAAVLVLSTVKKRKKKKKKRTENDTNQRCTD